MLPTTPVENAGFLIVKEPYVNLNFDEKYHFPILGLPTEIVQTIFMRCLAIGDVKGFMALSCVNVHSYICMIQLVELTDFKLLCPFGLTLLDAEEQGFKVDEETRIDKFEMLKRFRKLAPHVENNAGLTLLTVPKDMTLDHLLLIAEREGIEVVLYHPQVLAGVNAEPVIETYRVMISNAPITQTRQKLDNVQEARVRRVGFDRRPSLIEYLLLLISTQKVSNYQICLFGKGSYGHSSTSVGVNVFSFLAVGGDSACSRCYCIVDYFVKHEDCGAGAVLRF